MDPLKDENEGKVRHKMPVGEGRSLQHWMRKPREVQFRRIVTMDEVKKHHTKDDCWSVFRGRVYDTTKFFEYHPGGAKYMLMAAGRDGTALFDKYHKWVNIEFIMDKCLVGHLAEEDGHADSLKEDLESELRDEEEDEALEEEDEALKNAMSYTPQNQYHETTLSRANAAIGMGEGEASVKEGEESSSAQASSMSEMD